MIDPDTRAASNKSNPPQAAANKSDPPPNNFADRDEKLSGNKVLTSDRLREPPRRLGSFLTWPFVLSQIWTAKHFIGDGSAPMPRPDEEQARGSLQSTVATGDDDSIALTGMHRKASSTDQPEDAAPSSTAVDAPPVTSSVSTKIAEAPKVPSADAKATNPELGGGGGGGGGGRGGGRGSGDAKDAADDAQGHDEVAEVPTIGVFDPAIPHADGAEGSARLLWLRW